MTPTQRRNLGRLLQPRHVAILGGNDAEVVARECARIGYSGKVWPVNPKRSTIGGHRCFRSLDDLPEAPDAAFIAIPREPAVEAVGKLARMGAGGVVCYTAGFGETGHAGAVLEAEMARVAGDLAVIGPNCYGLINYVDRVALWPFTHGGFCPGYGAAIITQSGMLSSDLTMSQRSCPFAYMVSAGNQTRLAIEDFVEVFAGRDEVRAIGVHIEGLRSVPRFEAAAMTALAAGKPVVALKTGTSRLGAELTVSHTGSLSGTDDLYDALFDRLGVIRVTSPVELLETLKLLCIAGVPSGPRVAALTCSGGGATLVADHGERLGIAFPQPSSLAAKNLRRDLPPTATVANPLDYTTPIWGLPERTRPVFDTFLSEPADVSLIIQDYPAPGLDESKPSYRADTDSFIAAARRPGRAAIVCSTLPENLDAETREHLVAAGVAPMQGLSECLVAIAAAVRHGNRRTAILAGPPAPLVAAPAGGAKAVLLDEAAAKHIVAGFGVTVPRGVVTSGQDAPACAAELGFPVALKMVSARLPHKTEAGAVRLGLADARSVATAVAAMCDAVRAFDPLAATDRFLVERMAGPPLAELLVNVRRDLQFGYAMTLASGGTLVELLADAVTVLLPTTRADLSRALARLKLSPMLDGYRGRPKVDRSAVLDSLQQLAAHATQANVAEIEINPMFVMAEGIAAVDVLMRVDEPTATPVSA